MNGEILKQLRVVYGYSILECSKELGITSNYLYEIERGQKQPSRKLLDKYAQLFDLKPSSIMLLCEAYDKDETPAGGGFIRKLMINALQREVKRMEKEAIQVMNQC